MEYKILFTGTVGAGKTTAIASISDITPIVTDVNNTDASITKARTTVGLDYGLLTLENGDCVRLFGTPGQERFDFLWRILVKNALGMIILIDNSRPDPLADLSTYLKGFSSELAVMPCVIGIGRLDAHPSPGIDSYSALTDAAGFLIPILPVDARRKEDVLLLIDVLLTQIEPPTLGERLE